MIGITRIITISIVIFIALQAVQGLKRHKRDLDMESAFCVIGCVGEYYNRSALAGRNEDSGSVICRHVEFSQLNAICNMYNKGKECLLKECTGKPLADMLIGAARYGCDEHYEEFKKYTPCFTENCAFIENSCKTKCGSVSDAIKYSPEQKAKLDQIRRMSEMQQGKTPEGEQDSKSESKEGDSSKTDDSEEEGGVSGLQSLDILKNLNLDGLCKFADCYVNCTERPLTDKCGADNFKFFKKVVMDLTPMIFNGFFPNMTSAPPSCQAVMDRGHQDGQPGQPDQTGQAGQIGQHSDSTGNSVVPTKSAVSFSASPLWILLAIFGGSKIFFKL